MEPRYRYPFNPRSFVLGIAIGVTACGVAYVYEIFTSTKATMPEHQQVQAGYVNPSKLELEVKDLDSRGQKETVMRYNGQNYLVLDIGGQLRIVPFEIKPAETKPPEILLKNQ